MMGVGMNGRPVVVNQGLHDSILATAQAAQRGSVNDKIVAGILYVIMSTVDDEKALRSLMDAMTDFSTARLQSIIEGEPIGYLYDPTNQA